MMYTTNEILNQLRDAARPFDDAHRTFSAASDAGSADADHEAATQPS